MSVQRNSLFAEPKAASEKKSELQRLTGSTAGINSNRDLSMLNRSFATIENVQNVCDYFKDSINQSRITRFLLIEYLIV